MAISPFAGGPTLPGQFRSPEPYTTVPVVTAVNPNTDRVAGGAAITLTGKNFRNNSDGSAPAVTFGGVAASSVVVVDSQTITCLSPAAISAGTVNVSVTVGSQTGTLYGSFNYITSSFSGGGGIVTPTTPTGATQACSPASGNIAGGIGIVITGYNFVAGSTVTFGGVSATNVAFIDSQHLSCTLPAYSSPSYVDVVITEPGGAISTLANGFKYTSLSLANAIRRNPGVSINDVLNNTPNTCTFTLNRDAAPPQVGEQVSVTDPYDGDRLLFAGNVQTVEQDYDSLPTNLVWKISCVDFTGLLNRRFPFGAYTQVSASDIVRDLVSNYAPGFTTVHVQTTLAKVTAVFDGSKDFVTCLNDLASAIGGGHWYVDYGMDVHFFHTPPNIVVPPQVQSPAVSADHITLGTAGGIPTTDSYRPGYYFLRHTFIYNTGAESALGAISDVVYLDGRTILALSTIPLGADPGSGVTCTGRRVYYCRFSPRTLAVLDGSPTNDPIETIHGFAEIGDNTTTSFTAWMGTQGAEIGADVASVVPLPTTGATPGQPAGANHPAGPATAPVAGLIVVSGDTSLCNGGNFQFKYANLYRDGSVSAPSPASPTVSQPLIVCQGVAGFNLSGVEPGDSVNGYDVVARFVYICQGANNNPGATITTGGSNSIPTCGQVFGVSFADPDWAISHLVTGIIIVPDNTATELLEFSLSDYGTEPPVVVYPGLLVGAGNVPYNNSAVVALSSDPIPVWPNPDGPSLENSDPPAEINDLNTDVMQYPMFTSSVDMSQIRNRVTVIGAGSTLMADASIGALAIQVADISNFSPSGGKIKLFDPGTNTTQIVLYLGLSGAPGAAYVNLASSLTFAFPQGTTVYNWFQADDLASQKLMGQIETDVHGNATDGIHEYVIVDSSLKAVFQLYMRAYAELELFAMPITTITYSTRDPKSRSGQMVTVNLNNPPCKGSFLIQQVKIDQVRDQSNLLRPRYNVTASSVKYLLSDLLLSILDTSTTAASVSSGGIAAAATAAAVAAVPAASVQIATIDIPLSEYLTLFSAPIVLVTGVAGKIIMPIYAMLECNRVSTFGGSGSPTLNFLWSGIAAAALVQMAPGNSTQYEVVRTVSASGSIGFGNHPSGVDLILQAGFNATGGAGNTYRLTVAYMLTDAIG